MKTELEQNALIQIMIKKEGMLTVCLLHSPPWAFMYLPLGETHSWINDVEIAYHIPNMFFVCSGTGIKVLDLLPSYKQS